MKKTTEYLEKLYITQDGEPKSVHDSVENILDVFKQIQIETIETTCKRCAEEAEVKAQYKRNLKGSRYRTWKDESEVDLFSTTQKYSVNKQSILKVADKMKEELNKIYEV